VKASGFVEVLPDRKRQTIARYLANLEHKDRVYAGYDACTEEDVLACYFRWFDRVISSGVFDAFLDFTLTIEHWGDFIFNYFTYRYTGSFVEGANALARSVDRQGRGYSLAVLRARLLYGQHLLRQTKKRTPKASDVLETVDVEGRLVHTIASTQEAITLLS